jgi:hypothetical protein
MMQNCEFLGWLIGLEPDPDFSLLLWRSCRDATDEVPLFKYCG